MSTSKITQAPIKHAIAPLDTLLEYQRGLCDPAENVLVQTHCMLSAEAQSALREIISMQSQALMMQHEGHLSHKMDDAIAHIVALPQSSNTSTLKKPQTEATQTSSEQVKKFMAKNFANVPWKTVVPGVKQYDMTPKNSEYTLRLMDIKAGMTLSDHEHSGDEMTLILKGSMLDDNKRYTKGQLAFHAADETDQMGGAHYHHAPLTDEHCVCLVLMKGRLKFKGLIGRVAGLLFR